MNKIWFILIDRKREGPLSYDDLKFDNRLTPDTLIWKEGFDDWKMIRDVPELKELFNDSAEQSEQKESQPEVFDKKTAQDELVMDFKEPPYFLWFLVALISIIYVFLRLYPRN